MASELSDALGHFLGPFWVLREEHVVEAAQGKRDVETLWRVEVLELTADKSRRQAIGLAERFRDRQMVLVEIDRGHLKTEALQGVSHVAHVAADVQAAQPLSQGRQPAADTIQPHGLGATGARLSKFRMKDGIIEFSP